MKRWFYILLGGLGAALAATAAFMLFDASQLPPVFSGQLFQAGEVLAIIIGVGLGILGFINGRQAGELDVTRALKAHPRDHHVAGKEIDFECPICHKGYRASPMLAGKPFTCRECREIFDVPTVSMPPARPALPALPSATPVT